MSEPVTLPSDTPRLGLPFLFAGQAQKEAFVNEALARIDFALHPAFQAEMSEPPASPESGAIYLVAETPGGAWSDHPGELAGWSGSNWLFLRPVPGMQARNLQTGQLHTYDGQWVRAAEPPLPTGGTVIDSECRAAIVALVSQLRAFGIFSA